MKPSTEEPTMDHLYRDTGEPDEGTTFTSGSGRGSWKSAVRKTVTRWLPTSLFWSPDVGTLAVVPRGPKAAAEAQLWDTTTGTLRATVKAVPPSGGFSRLPPVVFAPDGKTLATLTGPGTVTVWEARGGKALGTVSLDEVKVGTLTPQLKALALSPDGKRLATLNYF